MLLLESLTKIVSMLAAGCQLTLKRFFSIFIVTLIAKRFPVALCRLDVFSKHNSNHQQTLASCLTVRMLSADRGQQPLSFPLSSKSFGFAIGFEAPSRFFQFLLQRWTTFGMY